jgi:hypothetical protein
MDQGIAFAKSFMQGDLQPFAVPVEDTDQFAVLSSAYSERNASIESAVMELAHGSCHTLTIALSEALGLSSAMVVADCAGMPVHSGLHNRELGLILDANGVHRVEDALTFWSRLAGGQCRAAPMEVDDLSSLSGCDDDDIAMALEDFGLIVDFIQAEII